jgi:SET domain-containing protein
MHWPAADVATYEVKHSGIHGRGLFAARELPARSIVGEYEGHSRKLSYAGDLRYTTQSGHGASLIDAANPQYEVGHFLNHSERPNATLRNIHGDDRVFLVTVRRVRMGEELCINYGRGYWCRHPLAKHSRSGRKIHPVVRPFMVLTK